MFECFTQCLSAIAMRPYTSSTGHRNAQRTNVASEIVGSSLETFTPAGAIPTKLAQTVTSIYSLFRADTHVPEKGVHFLQGCISAAQVGLAITMLFQAAACTTTDTDLCKAILLLQLLYRGTLLIGWIPSEFSKDPYAPVQGNAVQPAV